MELTQNHVEVGLSVADIERSLAFYCGTLGFTVAAQMPVDWGGTLHILRLGDAVVKLAINDDVPAAANPGGGAVGATGLRWISFWVTDVQAVVDQCRAAGATVPGEVNADYPGVKFAMVEDPDGNWIELVETVPAS
jgi:catechol 2,3-dioxygenase-like lactoylglutathione lyase family enzyme